MVKPIFLTIYHGVSNFSRYFVFPADYSVPLTVRQSLNCHRQMADQLNVDQSGRNFTIACQHMKPAMLTGSAICFGVSKNELCALTQLLT